jgi:dTDP-4-dehydrorhamnose reductase
VRILLLGASGLAGGVLWRDWTAAGHDVLGTRHRGDGPSRFVRLDLLDDAALWKLVEGPFDLVVHAAGMVDLATVQARPELAWRTNVRSVGVLLEALAGSTAKLVFLSSDNVFDGTRDTYDERDEPSPINVYGETKAAAERLVAGVPGHLVVRIPMLFGASPFSDKFLARFAGERTPAQTDVVCAPLYLPSLGSGLQRLWHHVGLVHYAGAQVLTRFELMSRIQRALGLDSEVVPVRDADARTAVRRPPRLVLRSERHDLQGPGLDEALAHWTRTT